MDGKLKTRIRELRAVFGMSQEDLAEKVGVRRETIARLEKGIYNPSLKLAMDIAKVIEKTVEEVFVFEESWISYNFVDFTYTKYV